MKKRETTMAFLAGVTVTGAFFAGMGMGSAKGSADEPLRYVGIYKAGGFCKYTVLREDGAVFNYCQDSWQKSAGPAPAELP